MLATRRRENNPRKKLRECFSTRGAQLSAGLSCVSHTPSQMRPNATFPCLERQVCNVIAVLGFWADQEGWQIPEPKPCSSTQSLHPLRQNILRSPAARRSEG